MSSSFSATSAMVSALNSTTIYVSYSEVKVCFNFVERLSELSDRNLLNMPNLSASWMPSLISKSKPILIIIFTSASKTRFTYFLRYSSESTSCSRFFLLLRIFLHSSRMRTGYLKHSMSLLPTRMAPHAYKNRSKLW